MDLEKFDDVDEILGSTSNASYTQSLRPQEALKEFDHQWYTSATRRARWMDLLGDYAGAELFLISGESLLERVLDDPLLALGRADDLSFQILHAYHILESTLLEFTTRQANFEIVFWQTNFHSTVHTGSSAFTVASRYLARSLLFSHLSTLPVVVHTFADLSDPSWLHFRRVRRPMFVLLSDGGVAAGGSFKTERTLCQRMFLFALLSRGMACALLNGTEFRDSKILSFIFQEPRPNHHPLSNAILEAAAKGKQALDAEICRLHRDASSSFRTAPAPEGIDVLQRMLQDIAFEFTAELLFIFVLHMAVLPKLSVADRAQPSQTLNMNLSKLLSTQILPKVFFFAAAMGVPWDIDGRVFTSLIRVAMSNPSTSLEDIVGPGTYAEARKRWAPLSHLVLNFPCFYARYPLPPSTSGTEVPAAPPVYTLLPFRHDALTSLLPHIAEDEEDAVQTSVTDVAFSDTTHWHNTKALLPSHLGGSDAKRVLDERQRLRENRSNQRFMAVLQKSAATLTGALGTSLQPITIVSVQKLSKGREPAVKERTESTSHARKGKAAVKPNSKQKLLDKIKGEKAASQDSSSYDWWQNTLNEMAPMSTDQKAERVKLLSRNKRFLEPAIGLEMRLYSLNLSILQWIENPAQHAVRDQYTLDLMRQIKDICSRCPLTPSASKHISDVLEALGFSSYASSLIPSSATLPDRPLTFEFTKLLKRQQCRYPFMPITEHPVIWQLRLFGEFMDRSMDGAPDPRVSFVPDAWQRGVLDCIDKDYSVLVIAPTSAGKTFISYYSMERVLRNSDDGILVYVAPTKALVTQIAAEIYARFKKNLDGKSLWAVHTRDYRINDPLKCQILVTVPEVLAILLLSPPLARVWTPRIKSIILDEIHSIGQQEGGAVWEQIILLAPCPIIGLSATVGSPENFSQWLESVQTAHGFRYKAIHHPHRYSHLRKFHYTLTEDARPEFEGLTLHKETGRTRFLHPISLLSFGAHSMPDDLALEASDTLTLSRVLNEHLTDCADLRPEVFFGSDDPRLLAQKDIIRYERALKMKLTSMMLDAETNSTQTDRLSDIVDALKDPKVQSLDLASTPSRESFTENLIFLLSDLHLKGMLPAILFNFDRSDCEILAQELVSTLQLAEDKWRSESPEWHAKLDQWDAWNRRAKERERRREMANKQKKDKDAPQSLGETDQSWEASFDPSDPSPSFSFAGSTSYSKSDLDEQIRQLRWSSTQTWAVDALRRGIAVHHAGMNKKYRSLIESLFRQGWIRVMIATGTLALGINAPAKTSVFCGDSPFLTALMYRQCSGRAGRRGFDLLGNVVFYGLPMERVQRLVLSKLPSLGGNFPLTSTLTLRLMNLLEGSSQADTAVKAVKSILSLPRISFGSDIGQEQVAHHFRFSVEYLRRSSLLNGEGRPINLFAIAAHLYYHEPSNFALVALLKSGALHDICQQANTVSAKKDFIHIMANLFGRRYISKVYASERNKAALTKKYPSMVELPPLPQSVRQVLVDHAQEIIHTFTGYALAYATQLESRGGLDHHLPLSKRSYPPIQDDPDRASIFRRHLEGTAIHVVARSPFVANSGHTDRFGSVEELARSARNGLHLNNNAIPSLAHLTATDSEHVLNAYLLDFYIHGQVSTLSIANGIRRGDVWYLLQDFVLLLATIKNSLWKLFTVTEATSTETDDHSFDPGEMDEEDDFDHGSEAGESSRPAGVSERDWRLYTIVSGALQDFDEKFKAMWA